MYAVFKSSFRKKLRHANDNVQGDCRLLKKQSPPKIEGDHCLNVESLLY